MADRRLHAALLLSAFALAGLHVRLYREEQRSRGQGTLSVPKNLRSWTHDVVPREGTLEHAITMVLDIDLREPVVLKFSRRPRLTGGPVAFDVLGNPLSIAAEVVGDDTIITFPPPPPAFGAVRQITIGFTTDAPRPTYGWGYRAVAVPWAARSAPPRVPAIVQAHVEQTISAHGFRCSAEPEGRVCAIDAQRRSTLAVPIAPVADTPWRLVFALSLILSVSGVMFAIYRRWSALAARMGVRDSAPLPTTEEALAEVSRPSRRPSIIEGDPFEAVALVARGIVAVLGVVASIFVVGTVEGGFLPLVAPLALSVWALVAGTVLVLAVGIDRPRAWVAVLLLAALEVLAVHPLMRWMVPGLAVLAGAVLMQLTARQQP